LQVEHLLDGHVGRLIGDDRLVDAAAGTAEEDDAVVEQNVAGAVLPLPGVVAEALVAANAGERMNRLGHVGTPLGKAEVKRMKDESEAFRIHPSPLCLRPFGYCPSWDSGVVSVSGAGAVGSSISPGTAWASTVAISAASSCCSLSMGSSTHVALSRIR